MKYKSNAEWPPEKVPNLPSNITSDTHDTEEQAAAVCGMLEIDGFGGDREFYPLRTWVEPVKESP